jgi:hypothetical protein
MGKPRSSRAGGKYQDFDSPEIANKGTYTWKAEARDFAHRSIPTQACVAPHTTKIHTLSTLGIRNRSNPLVLKPRNRCPCGFDSHRPLHFSLSGVLLRCLRTRLSSSSSSHSLDAATVHLIECVDRLLGRARSPWPHPSVIDPNLPLVTVCFAPLQIRRGQLQERVGHETLRPN